MNNNQRREQGLEKLRQIDGRAGEEVVARMEAVSPDLARYIIEYAFGDIYSRDGLSLPHKEMAVVAALTALGNAELQLKVHLHGALNVGCSVNSLKEIILQMASYSGFPTAINAMNALKDVLTERKGEGFQDPEGSLPAAPPQDDSPDARYRRGAALLSQLDSGQVRRLEEAYGDFSPALVQAILHSYADIYSRDNLPPRQRQLATIAALTALGNARPQLKFHIAAGMNAGLSSEEIQEIILLMTVYAGFPAAINAMALLQEVLREAAAASVIS